MLAESDYFNSMATDRSVDVQSTVAVGYPQVTEVAQVNPSRIIKAHWQEAEAQEDKQDEHNSGHFDVHQSKKCRLYINESID